MLHHRYVPAALSGIHLIVAEPLRNHGSTSPAGVFLEMLAAPLEVESERIALNVRGWLHGMDALDASACPPLLRGCLLALVDATPGLVMVSSSKGQMLYMNAMGRQMLGFDRNANLTARRVFDLYSQRSCELLLEEAIPTCLQAGVWRGEATLLDRDK